MHHPHQKIGKKGDGSPCTSGDYTNKIASIILVLHVNSTIIICVNDPYDKPVSKMMGAFCASWVKIIFLMYSWSSVTSFSQPIHSKPFFEVLVTRGVSKPWSRLDSEISQPFNQELLYSVGMESVCLSSGYARDELSFNQCEADSIMLSIYGALRSLCNSDPVDINAEDTISQCFTLLPIIICIKKKKELLSCKDICTDENMAKCLKIPFQIMTD